MPLSTSRPRCYLLALLADMLSIQQTPVPAQAQVHFFGCKAAVLTSCIGLGLFMSMCQIKMTQEIIVSWVLTESNYCLKQCSSYSDIQYISHQVSLGSCKKPDTNLFVHILNIFVFCYNQRLVAFTNVFLFLG